MPVRSRCNIMIGGTVAPQIRCKKWKKHKGKHDFSGV